MTEADRFAGLYGRTVKIVDRGKLSVYRFPVGVSTQASQQAVEPPGKAAEESDTAWLMREMPGLNLSGREQEELLGLARFSDFDDRSGF